MLKGKKLAVIGVGKMGEALVKGLLKKGDLSIENIYGSVAHKKSLTRVQERVGIEITLDNKVLAKKCDILILAVKPQNIEQVLQDISGNVAPKQLVISIAASVTSKYIEERLPDNVPVVRAMPNIASVVNKSMTVLSSGSRAREKHMKTAESIFKSVGETVILDEHLMDGVTGLSASGPAFLSVVIESLAESGVKLGIPRNISTFLVAQTMLGTAQLVIELKTHPALLKDEVTTPAGCTIDGLLELEEGKLRVTLIKAVVKAAERAKELVFSQNGTS